LVHSTSYEENIGLCGFSSKEKCTHEEPRLSPPTSEETYSNSRINEIDWNFLNAELGFVFGFGIIIGPLMFWKRWRICYYKHVNDIFLRYSIGYILELKIAKDEYKGIKDNEHTKIKDGGISNRYKEQCSQVRPFFFLFFFSRT
jgi:hypothetical protein